MQKSPASTTTGQCVQELQAPRGCTVTAYHRANPAATARRAMTTHRTAALVVTLLSLAAGASAAEGPAGHFALGANLGDAAPDATYQDWYAAAYANLSSWRNGIFTQTMQITKAIHQQRVEAALSNAQRQIAAAGATAPPNELLNAERPHVHAYGMFQLSNPFITCPPGAKLGKVGGIVGMFQGRKIEDGHKYLCGAETLKAPCTVLSIGSRADTTFEQAILDATPCEVVTLDCTLREPLQTLGERHKFFPLCLGSEQQSKVNAAFVSLPQLMQRIGRQRADILKMDIEGYEWDVLASLGTDKEWEASLPTQLAIEVHVGGIYRNSPSYMKSRDFNNLLWPLHLPSFSQLQLMMLHIADMGYGIISRDDNPVAPACTELTFYRIKPQE